MRDLGAAPALAFADSAAYVDSLPDDVHAVVHLGPGLFQGHGACNATISHPTVTILGEGSETTIFDCGWQSRWLTFTGTSLTLSGVTIYNASSYNNAMEPGGLVSGGAVLVDWVRGGTNLSVTMSDLVVVGGRAEFDASAGHVGDYVMGGAIGVVMGPDGPVEDVALSFEDCVLRDVKSSGGGCWVCTVHANVQPPETCSKPIQ